MVFFNQAFYHIQTVPVMDSASPFREGGLLTDIQVQDSSNWEEILTCLQGPQTPRIQVGAWRL